MKIKEIKENKKRILLNKEMKNNLKGGGLSGGGSVLPD